MEHRRVVTGTDTAGKAVVVSNEPAEAVTVSLAPGLEFRMMWGSDQTVTLPTDGTKPGARTYFPSAGGFRFSYVTIPPEGRSERPGGGSPASSLEDGPASQASEAMREAEEKLPGLFAHNEPDNPGMHTTDTIDFDVVLSGEIWLELDDGAETRLLPGDTVVQIAGRHAWRNRTDGAAIVAFVLTGARSADQCCGLTRPEVRCP